jgi:hypothetical protein
MREMLRQQAFNRRKVLVSLISTAPVAALAFSGEAVAKVAQGTAQYPAYPQRGAIVRRLQFLHRSQRLQAGRGRDLSVGLVPLVDQEGGLTEERLVRSRADHRMTACGLPVRPIQTVRRQFVESSRFPRLLPPRPRNASARR